MNSKAKIIAILVGAALAGPAFGVFAALKFAPSQANTESEAKASAPIEHKPEVMIAKITRELIDGTSCSVGEFNNATGRMSERGDTCSALRREDTSVLAPMGTIHRLEAIQNSFLEDEAPKPNTPRK
jgi:hypothetical protein